MWIIQLQKSFKDIKQFFRIFVVSYVVNPEFESQNKHRLENPKVPAVVKTSEISKILKWSVIEDIEDIDNSSDNDSNSNNDKNIKILKLNISNEEEPGRNNEFYLEEPVDLNSDFEPNDDLSEIGNDYVDEVLDLKYNENSKEDIHLGEQKDEPIVFTSDLKTISINLGEENTVNEGVVDYKKLQLPKLRSVVVEKGLASNTDVAKLKKTELFKLLGVE
jgi:hypothetical protein